MLTVDALKEVYKSLGGSADDVANMTLNADVIAAIATKVAGAGSVLPSVDAEDNGKRLAVVSGEWAAAAAELPAVEATDVGKVLTVNAEGKWAAVLPEA
jgi:hypothetical protein